MTGVDQSPTALQHVRTEAVLASATKLPFADGSFDLVLSSEMLEHLPTDDYRQAIAEMSRVSRRYLLISVPYKEVLEFRTIRCPECGWRGHVWGHRQGPFTAESLVADLVGYSVAQTRTSDRCRTHRGLAGSSGCPTTSCGPITRRLGRTRSASGARTPTSGPRVRSARCCVASTNASHRGDARGCPSGSRCWPRPHDRVTSRSAGPPARVPVLHAVHRFGLPSETFIRDAIVELDALGWTPWVATEAVEGEPGAVPPGRIVLPPRRGRWSIASPRTPWVASAIRSGSCPHATTWRR